MTAWITLEKFGECIYLGMYARHGIDPKTAPPINPLAARCFGLFFVSEFFVAIVLFLCGYR